MPITLNNFKNQIEPTILQRGRQYFNQHFVIDLEEIEDGRWQTQVEGTEIYIVEIKQTPDGSLDHYCSCLYDWGPQCKHIAASLYAIEETFPQYFESPKKHRKPRKKRKTKAEKLDELLKNISKEDLVEIVRELALGDRQVYNQIDLKFGRQKDKHAYTKQVKDALKEGKDRHGFIDYWGADRAARAVNKIIGQAQKLHDQNLTEEAISILQAVIENVTEAIFHADDSNGSLGGCISYSIIYLGEVAQFLGEVQRNDLRIYLSNEALDEKYSGWDWAWDLAQLAADLITTTDERQQVFQMLDTMAGHSLRSETYAGFLDNFDFYQAQKIKLSVIQRLDGTVEAENFLRQHIENQYFREELVKFLIGKKRLEEAKEVCNNFLLGPNGTHRFYRTFFLQSLLEIAQAQQNNREILRLAKELFLSTHQFIYYELLKNSSFDESWEHILRELLDKSPPDILSQIYVREEMWNLLLEAAYKMSEYSVENYRSVLERQFPKEICDIYERLIYKKLEQTPNRATYQAACRYLRRIKKLGNQGQMRSIIADLQERYKRRPALMDELNKIK